ncbi:MAG: relaxase/mobilization nuclease domain-containing protein, partial [Pseudomonadota bacterium]
MIPFASQRGHGQDLATHLLNAQDNEYLELADLRGSVAEDLHGAFAEWEAEAAAMTRCRNYLYSLSVNPDRRQGPLPRELYAAYVDRIEEALGLAGQPRAVVFHIKEGREHAHVIWSRVDVQEMKAIHMAFDREKLMGVTRAFAREHGIELAPGYHRLEDRARQAHRQMNAADKAAKDNTGESREAREARITELWRRRDSPEAFISSLQDAGFILCHGKRPFALVDAQGVVNSLPRLIADRQADTKAIRAFLGDAGAADALPTVGEAKALAKAHAKTLKVARDQEARAEQLAALRRRQAERRADLERQAAELKEKQMAHREHLNGHQAADRSAHAASYAARVAFLEAQREAAAPTGVARFLAQVSGVAYLRSQLHAYQDRKRNAAHEDAKRVLAERHAAERADLQARQEMQRLDLERRLRGLDKTEAREQASLKQAFEREDRQRAQTRTGPSPAPRP